MEDIILMDPEQTEYEQIDVYDPIQDDKQDFVNIEKIEKVEEESIQNESKQINQSNDIVLLRDANNNNNSLESISLDNYNQYSLWSNNSPNSAFTTTQIPLSENLNDFDLIGIEYKFNSSSDLTTLYIIRIDDLNLLSGGTSNLLGLNAVLNSSYVYSRTIGYRNNTFNIDYCVRLQGSVVDNNYCIPINIYGYKAKTIDINDNPSQIVSGNNIYNYNIYCGSLSDDSLSNNLLNKPLNNYSVSESILLFIFMGLFVAGFSWFIKKNIFKL